MPPPTPPPSGDGDGDGDRGAAGQSPLIVALAADATLPVQVALLLLRVEFTARVDGALAEVRSIEAGPVWDVLPVSLLLLLFLVQILGGRFRCKSWEDGWLSTYDLDAAAGLGKRGRVCLGPRGLGSAAGGAPAARAGVARRAA